jgi:hypothetical protein
LPVDDAPGADTRLVSGSRALDLASLGASMGDTIESALEARDSAGQVSRSAALRIVVTPNRVADDSRRWPTLLGVVSQQAERAAQRAGDAALHLADADPRGAARLARANGSDLHDLVEALLAAVTASPSAESSVLLERLIDAVQARASELEAAGAEPASQGDPLARIRDAIGGGEQVARERALAARVLKEAAEAAAILAQMANADALPPGATSDELRRDARAAAERLGLSGPDEAVRAQLAERVASASRLAANQSPVDFAAAARAWAEGNDERDASLADRLNAAWRGEALRPGADAQRAADLQLSARAAERLRSNDTTGDDRERFASAVQQLQSDHATRHRPDATDAERARSAAAAAEARSKLEAVAGPGDATGRPNEAAAALRRAAGGPSPGIVLNPVNASVDPRPWGDPRPTSSDARSAPPGDEAPGIYRDALRAYFKAINSPDGKEAGR